MRAMRTAMAGLLLGACGEPEPLHYTAEDGAPCFDEGSNAYRFVFETGCLSSSCDPIEELDCAITRNGSTLLVEAEVWIGQPKTDECNDDCGAALCPLAVDESIATIQYGETVVPVETLPACGI